MARMGAHITYMSEASLEHKFGRCLQDHDTLPIRWPSRNSPSKATWPTRAKFVERFDANSYLYITKAIDYFDIGADYGSLRAALERTQCAFLVVSFTSDWLYTLQQAQDLVEPAPRAGSPGRASPHRSAVRPRLVSGEVDRMSPVVGGYLDRAWAMRRLAQALCACGACSWSPPLSTTSL